VIDDAMQALLDEFDIPGATLAVAKDERMVYSKGFGVMDDAIAHPAFRQG
jgi:hypothetical protein